MVEPFDRQELESLLHLVRERRAYVVEHTQAPWAAREELAQLEAKLVEHLADVEFSRAIAEDIRRGLTSGEIRDEIITKVGMMGAARTPEMQARYDAAVVREGGHVGRETAR